MGVLSALAGPAKWVWNKVRGRPTVEATDASVGVGRDAHGQVNTGGQAINVPGSGVGIGQAGTINIHQSGEDPEARRRVDELSRRVKELESLISPGQGPPVDASALVREASADPDATRIFIDAIELQRRHEDRAAVEKLLTAYREEMSPRAKAQLFVLAGNAYAHLGDFNSAKGYFSRAVDLARTSDDSSSLATSLGNLSTAMVEQGDLTSALGILRESLQLSIEHKLVDLQLSNLNTLSVVLRDMRELEQSTEAAREAIQIAIALNNEEAKAAAHNNLGLIFCDQIEYETASREFHEALAIARRIGNRRAEAQALGNLGNIALSRDPQRLQEARAFHEEALAIDRDIGFRLGEAQDLGNLGNVLRFLEEFEDARRCYESALAIFAEIGALDAANLTRRHLGSLELKE